MNSIRAFLTCAGVACACANIWAADLSKIERTIVKEPSYRNNAPTYCLLVFGPSTKTRLWLVLDGTDLYVDKNCDGELNATDERFEKDGKGFTEFEITDKSGKVRYKFTSISVIRLKRAGENILMLSAHVTILGKYRQYSAATPSDRLKDAPVCHFHGPLALDINRDRKGVVTQKLVTGDNPEELNVMIGTFDRKNGCWVVIENRERNQAEDFPDGLHPVVEVESAPRQAGRDPIRIRNPLTERC